MPLRDSNEHDKPTLWSATEREGTQLCKNAGTPGGIREPAKLAMSSRPLADRNPHNSLRSHSLLAYRSQLALRFEAWRKRKK